MLGALPHRIGLYERRTRAQYSVLDPAENAELAVLLPMPTVRRPGGGSR